MQAKLLEIHRNTQHVRRQRCDRDLVLALNRSDYMLDEPSGTLMQVQLMPMPICNTSARQAHTHTHILQHTHLSQAAYLVLV